MLEQERRVEGSSSPGDQVEEGGMYSGVRMNGVMLHVYDVEVW